MKYVRSLASVIAAACVAGAQAQSGYVQTILVANDPAYEPLNLVDPLLGNGWGVALRPPGAGGHFWISNFNTGTTTTYVGDVRDANGVFTPLYQDSLTVVEIPPGNGVRYDGRPTAPIAQPTGQVFNYSPTDFVVSGEGITGASKFIFVTGEGTISGWTEVRDAQGVLHRQTRAVIMVDQSQSFDDDRLRFTGCAVTDFGSNNRLYATNFTKDEVEVYDHEFRRLDMPPGRFRYPGQPDGFRAWNIQYFRTGPGGEGRLWVAYALMEEPWEEDPDFGAVAEFDLEGNFIRRLLTTLDFDPMANSELRAPWGLAIAPADFGPLSGTMLAANFGDGSIAAFDLNTGRFVDFVRDDAGEIISVDGVWGIAFGNGVALGDTDALYFAAGPNNEVDGTFGTIRLTSSTCPVIQEQPAPISVCPGATAVLSVSAPSPVGVRYRWQSSSLLGVWTDLMDGPIGDTGAVASGSNTATLHIASMTAAAAITYRCIIENACGAAESAIAEIAVRAPDDPACATCDADVNCDGSPDQGDVACMILAVAGDASCLCGDADFNRDGSADQGDLAAVISVVAGGPCP